MALVYSMLSFLLTVETHLTETVSRENLSGLLVLEALITKEAKAWWNSSMADCHQMESQGVETKEEV